MEPAVRRSVPQACHTGSRARAIPPETP